MGRPRKDREEPKELEAIGDKDISSATRYFLPRSEWIETKNNNYPIIDPKKPPYYQDEEGDNIPQMVYIIVYDLLRGKTLEEAYKGVGKTYNTYATLTSTFQRDKKRDIFQRAFRLAHKHIQSRLEKRKVVESGFNFAEMSKADLLNQYGYYSSMLIDKKIDDKAANALMKMLDSVSEIKGLKGNKKAGTENNLTINSYSNKTNEEINNEIKKVMMQLQSKGLDMNLLEKAPEPIEVELIAKEVNE